MRIGGLETNLPANLMSAPPKNLGGSSAVDGDDEADRSDSSSASQSQADSTARATDSVTGASASLNLGQMQTPFGKTATGAEYRLFQLGPPPEDLIKKSIIDTEPIKSGAGIAFIKYSRLMGRERTELLNPDNGGPAAQRAEPTSGANPQGDGPTQITAAQTIHDYMLNAREAGALVYCRFGEKYLQDMERRKNSTLSSANQPMNNLSSATYLINIKKLVDEHNIEGEKRDFKSMRTGHMQKAIQHPPQQFYRLTGPEDTTLIFESRFESGNLLAAIKVSENEYDLILQNDINTNGHTQWYFFRVGNTRRGMRVKFNMLNLAKPDSLYNYGMKALCFSNKLKEEEGVGWHRVGQNIAYVANQYKREVTRYRQ